MKSAFLLAIAALTLTAQIGQIPGTYPPGQYPGHYPSVVRRTEVREGALSKDHARGETRERPYRSGERRGSEVDADSFELEAEDTRFLIIQFSDSAAKKRVADRRWARRYRQHGSGRHVSPGKHETEQGDRRHHQ